MENYLIDLKLLAEWCEKGCNNKWVAEANHQVIFRESTNKLQ